MDIDFMNKSNTSSTDQQVDQMMDMMLMHMEKLPDFSDISDYPIEEFTNHHLLPTNNVLDHTQPLFNHPTMSFSSNNPPPPPHEEPYLQQIHGKPARNSSMAAMREMIFRIAAMQPIYIDPESVKPPKRRNVKISTDPQSVAARHRRERISERIRILQRMVPGGTKMDTASMLDEAIHYVKFLKDQVQSLERVAVNNNRPVSGVGFPVPMSSGSGGYFPVVGKGYNCQTTTMPTNLQHLTDR